MSTHQSWLQLQADTLKLTDTDIERLQQAGYCEREDFEGVDADALMRDTAGHREGGVKRPVAIRVLKAAGALASTSTSPAPPPVTNVSVTLADKDEAEEIRDALAGLTGPHKVAAKIHLRRNGVERVVLATDGATVDVVATLDYLSHDAPLSKWWDSKRVVTLDEVGPRKLHHPRTSVVLDKTDPVGWHELTRAQLVVAAAIYLEGLDRGDSERMVLLMVKTDDTVAKTAITRLEADADLRRRAEDRVDGISNAAPVSSADGPVRRARGPAETRPVLGSAKSREGQVCDLFVALFSADELRRFLSYTYDGIGAHLPGTTTMANLAFEAAMLLSKHGHLDSGLLWRKLIAERPSRASEVTAVAALFGVHL